MLITKFYNNIIQTTLRHLNVQILLKSNKLQYRNFINDSQNQEQLPALSDSPQIIWPNIFKTLSNFIQCNLLIRPYMDTDFIMAEFLEGSKQALSVVSKALAREDYDSIEGLVTKDTLQNIKNKISTLTIEQRKLLAMDKEDIYLLFPYQVGIIFDKEKAQQRFVEILVVFHCLRGLNRLNLQDADLTSRTTMTRLNNLMYVCNYRFIREFTKDIESPWTINMINHFMPSMV